MTPGDLICGDTLILTTFTSDALYLCLSVDKKAQEADCQIIANRTQVFNTIEKPKTIRLYDPLFRVISWNSPTQHILMAGRPIPNWCHVALSQHSSNVLSATSNISQQQNPTGYPLGSLIFGNTKANDVWIITKDGSREVSLLWDGKASRWTGSKSEHRNQIISNLPARSLSETCRQINNNLTQAMHVGPNDLPSWAMAMILSTGPMPQTIAQYKSSQQIVKPDAAEAIAAMGVISQKKVIQPPVKRSIDTFRGTCHHRFLAYIGFREVYEYCAECDFTRPVKK
jgi:hypothetical protein